MGGELVRENGGATLVLLSSRIRGRASVTIGCSAEKPLASATSFPSLDDEALEPVSCSTGLLVFDASVSFLSST